MYTIKTDEETFICYAILVLMLVVFLSFMLMMSAASAKSVASVYSEDVWTATGQRFDPTKMAAAHKTLPFGTKITVVHKATRRSAVVIINDRGPFIRGRELDLTPASAKALKCAGLCNIEIQSWPPLP